MKKIRGSRLIGTTALCSLLAIVGCGHKKSASPSVGTPPPPLPNAYFNADPQTITAGESTQLSWETKDAKHVSINGRKANLSGSRTVTPRKSTTYRLIAKGPGGKREVTAHVTVNAQVIGQDQAPQSSGRAEPPKSSIAMPGEGVLQPAEQSAAPSAEGEAQQVPTIEGLSNEIRSLRPAACDSAVGSASRQTIYQTNLQKAINELRAQLLLFRTQIESTSIIGDAKPKILASLNQQLSALGAEKVCDAAEKFSGVPQQAAIPDISISRESIPFSRKEVGDTEEQSFSITNKGDIPLTDLSVQLCRKESGNCEDMAASRGLLDLRRNRPGAPTTKTDFIFAKGSSDDVCPKALGKSEHCDVTIRFKPETAGSSRAWVYINYNGLKPAQTVRLSGDAFVANLAELNGDGSGGGHPSLRSVVGFDISGASSSDTEQKAFLEFDLDAPIGKSRGSVDPLNHRLWGYVNPRITSLPQSATAIADLNTQGLADFISAKKTDLVQGLDVQGGLEYMLLKPRDGIPFWASYKNAHARMGVALVAGAGFSTPFSSPGTNSPVFTLDPNSPLRTTFGGTDKNGNPVPIDSKFTNIAFVSEERSRLFRKVFMGLRLKTYHFSDLARGNCDEKKHKSGSTTEEQTCEAVYNAFPGVIDFTAAKDEQVTGGHLTNWIFRLDAIYPLPFAPQFSVFGSLSSAFEHNVSTPAIVLPPISSTALSDPSVFVVNVPQRDRDIYRIGLGVDLVQVIKKLGSGKQQEQDKPQAQPSGGSPGTQSSSSQQNGTKPPSSSPTPQPRGGTEGGANPPSSAAGLATSIP